MAHRDPESNGEDVNNTLVANTRCSFCFPCFGTRRSSAVGIAWWERIRSVHIDEDKWWFSGFLAFKKIREWSEIVAGPRWKTFIRRFNRSRSGAGGSGSRHAGKFQYDPLSYALNFDEGPGKKDDIDGDYDYPLYQNFSTRYASVPSQKSSSALDSSKDAAVFS
ncbi:uncharacterized protein LOC121235031 [Juglans microcarpa x Juglans regia]|uniref:uncharacterized protein LOC121235031 n=1 Tax=Juglans microcarpa x Juglans regia TaxID=2249226 RepID=UPI001B7EC939|nr:uncharacterized protein LOC121235031 [Juglans microcarpa x Juglans regia]